MHSPDMCVGRLADVKFVANHLAHLANIEEPRTSCTCLVAGTSDVILLGTDQPDCTERTDATSTQEEMIWYLWPHEAACISQHYTSWEMERGGLVQGDNDGN